MVFDYEYAPLAAKVGKHVKYLYWWLAETGYMKQCITKNNGVEIPKSIQEEFLDSNIHSRDWLTVKEFSELRGLNSQTVTNFIRSNGYRHSKYVRKIRGQRFLEVHVDFSNIFDAREGRRK